MSSETFKFDQTDLNGPPKLSIMPIDGAAALELLQSSLIFEVRACGGRRTVGPWSISCHAGRVEPLNAAD